MTVPYGLITKKNWQTRVKGDPGSSALAANQLLLVSATIVSRGIPVPMLVTGQQRLEDALADESVNTSAERTR